MTYPRAYGGAIETWRAPELCRPKRRHQAGNFPIDAPIGPTGGAPRPAAQSLAGWRHAHRQRHIAEFDVSRVELEPGLAPVAPLLEHRLECRAVGAEHLNWRTFGEGQVRRNAHRCDRHGFLRLGVEPHLTAAARKARK